MFDQPEAWRFCIAAAASLKTSIGTVRTLNAPSTTLENRTERMLNCSFGGKEARALWQVRIASVLRVAQTWIGM